MRYKFLWPNEKTPSTPPTSRPPRTARTPRKPRRSSALSVVKPPSNEPETIQLEPDDLIALQKTHLVIAEYDFKLTMGRHFLEKLEDEIEEKYGLTGKYNIDLATGEITSA